VVEIHAHLIVLKLNPFQSYGSRKNLITAHDINFNQ